MVVQLGGGSDAVTVVADLPDGAMKPASLHDNARTLVLTGASRGIGHATVKKFSAAGWRIIHYHESGQASVAGGGAFADA